MPLTYDEFQELVMGVLEDHYAFKFDDLEDSYGFTSVETGLSGYLDYAGKWVVSTRFNNRVGFGESLEAAIEAMNKEV